MKDTSGLEWETARLLDILAPASVESVAARAIQTITYALNRGIEEAPLRSPMRQVLHALALRLTIPETGGRELQAEEWRSVESGLNRLYECYYPSPDAFPSQDEILWMFAFGHFFEVFLIVRPEDAFDTMTRYYGAFDADIRRLRGVPISAMVRALEEIRETTERTYAERMEECRTYFEKLPDVAELAAGIGWPTGDIVRLIRDLQDGRILGDLLEACTLPPRLDPLADQGNDVGRWLARFVASPEAFSKFRYPTDPNPLLDNPILRLADGRAVVWNYDILIRAVLADLAAALDEAGRADKFHQQRARQMERDVEAVLKVEFPGANIYRNVYRDPNSRLEHDILVLEGNTAFVVEVKSNRLRPPLRDWHLAVPRLVRDFEPVQEAYLQAEALRVALLSSETTVLYDKRGKVIAEVPRPREVYCICVLSERMGWMTTDLSRLLHLRPEDPFPWAVTVGELQQISKALRLGYGRTSLGDYIRRRVQLHGGVIATDELEIATLIFDGPPVLDDVIRGGRRMVCSPEASDLFDSIYARERAARTGRPPPTKFRKPPKAADGRQTSDP